MTPTPCPFCAGVEVRVRESAESFRWRHAYCAACGAIGPEVRIQTIPDTNVIFTTAVRQGWEDDAARRAIEEWNTRKVPSHV